MLSGSLQDPALTRGGAIEPSGMSATWPNSIKIKIIPRWCLSGVISLCSTGSGPTQPDSAPMPRTFLPVQCILSRQHAVPCQAADSSHVPSMEEDTQGGDFGQQRPEMRNVLLG